MTAISRDLQSYFYRRVIAKEDGPTIKPAPKAAGIALKAADTGRILMLQRSLSDVKDPARGKLEFPGGCLEPGEDAFDAAVREWEEEVGVKLPPGRHAGTWTSPNGVYRGHLYVVPHEGDIKINLPDKSRPVKNPDNY